MEIVGRSGGEGIGDYLAMTRQGSQQVKKPRMPNKLSEEIDSSSFTRSCESGRIWNKQEGEGEARSGREKEKTGSEVGRKRPRESYFKQMKNSMSTMLKAHRDQIQRDVQKKSAR